MKTTGIILAGGKASRMGGIDKGLALLHGRPLVAHVVERLRPQVDMLMINANREIERYRRLGHPVIADLIPGFAGPLAGLHCGMQAAGTEFVVSVPCDSPLLPEDLVSRLADAMRGADLAVARTGRQRHPVFCLCRTALLPDLTRFLESGGRKVEDWHAGLNRVEVDFEDEASAFANINTAAELSCLQQPA
ncbi:MAG: molybdenum cofactor guanylyltransferase [Methylobacterium sp.]|nr:molybdenum cofactor guanylyltransferase [Methylobacterium sp.]